jgi:hypothetical protein
MEVWLPHFQCVSPKGLYGIRIFRYCVRDPRMFGLICWFHCRKTNPISNRVCPFWMKLWTFYVNFNRKLHLYCLLLRLKYV